MTLVASAALALTPFTLQAPPSSDWTDLFDGAALSGWVGEASHWTVEDGAIVGRSTPENPCERTTYLRLADREFDDFELSVDYFIEGGNSGVQFRSRHTDGFQVEGYQADLDAANDWTGGVYDQGGRGVVNRRAVRMLAARPNTTYELLGDPAELAKLGGPGAWHTYRIRAVGSRISLWIDDVLTCEYDDREPEADAAGIFALQLHEGPPMEVRFRNLRVRVIEAKTPASAAAGHARWIWRRGASNETGTCRFERTIRAKGPLKRATLWATCDNGVEFSFRDVVFAGSEEWTEPFEIELRPRFCEMLGSGEPHVLSAECWNTGGPAGLIARLVFEYEDGTTEAIETDRWWRVDGELAEEHGFWGVEPWGVPTGRGSGLPDLPLAASKIALPAGFVAEEILRVPRAYGSWAVMTLDDHGRLICGAENGPGLYRVTLGEDGRAAEIEELGIDIHATQGLAARGNDLYIVRNAYPFRGNGLYRARDTDGDDQYDALRLLASIGGGGEHGPHAIRFTPDGQHLEMIAGNSTRFPSRELRYAMVADWSEDQLLPSLPDTFGHGNQMHLHGGWLGRCNLDGRDWEILCVGMRNAYDFAYDASGERFAYDADMEWDIGAPWYRAPRVLHLVPGAEFGWRRGSGKIMDVESDNFGSVCETGPSSPTGVVHGKDGGFPGEWRERLFLGDWTRGAVYAVDLEQEADTFRGSWREFAKGTPLPITDLAWLADGSLALLTGGRGNRSALYRVRCTLPADETEVVTRALPTPGPRAELAARIAFERNEDIDSWAPRALEDGDDVARLALARVGGKEWQVRLLGALVAQEEPLDRGDLRVCELSIARDGLPEESVATELRKRLDAALGAIEIEGKLIALLVALDSSAVPAFAVPRMEAAETQERMIALALPLRLCKSGWTDDLARRALDVLHGCEGTLRGGRSVDGYVKRIREALREVVAPALTGEYVPPERPTEVERVLEAPEFVKHWDMTTLAMVVPRIEQATDRDAGRRAFERAGCVQCHRVGDLGGGTGPDLTNAAGRFTVRDLLFALLEPSKDISDQYRDTEVWTTDGEVYVGRLESRTEELVTLRLPPSEPGGIDGDLVDIEVDDIHVERPHPNSRMPAGTIDCLQSEEIVEMLAWLLGNKGVR